MNFWMRIFIPVVAGYILDLIVGDPHWMYHPVRLIGKWIEVTEPGFRKMFPASPSGQRKAGLLLVISTVGLTGMVTWLLTMLCQRIHPALGLIFRILLCYWLLATRSLRDESMKVYDQLKKEDLPGARKAVSMIVGRDTQNLTYEGVTKAAVETVAENTSDGVIAPMFYMVIGGPVLGWMYKAVNTMDSMVGYKNDRYLNYGRYAAKFDDIVNFVPARVSGLLMILSCSLAGLDRKNAWRIFKRDRYNHASPNSAQTESVMAGALGVQLAGDAYYFGKLFKKKTIGDPQRKIEAEDIRRANRLLYVTSLMSLIIFLAVRVLIFFCTGV